MKKLKGHLLILLGHCNRKAEKGAAELEQTREQKRSTVWLNCTADNSVFAPRFVLGLPRPPARGDPLPAPQFTPHYPTPEK